LARERFPVYATQLRTSAGSRSCRQKARIAIGRKAIIRCFMQC
jgi:hypothetical protein